MKPFIPTKEQAAVIKHARGHACVNAVPGSGKSKTMVARVQHLLANNVPVGDILVLMFNVSAKDHFKASLKKLYKEKARIPLVSTFDAMALRACNVLSSHSSFHAAELVTATWRHHKICKEALKQLFNPGEIDNPRFIQDFSLYVERVKSGLITTASGRLELAKSMRDARFADAFGQYEMLRKNEKIRFYIDLSYDLHEYIHANPNELEKLPKYRYVIVDEGQDMTRLNLSLLKMVGRSAEVMAVGDPDQTVYTFRGADPKILVDEFSQHFPSAVHYSLSRTFRYGANLSYTADTLMSNEVNRQRKASVSTANAPDTQVILTVEDGNQNVVTEVQGWKACDEKTWSDIAILFRVFASSLPYQLQLLRAGVPFRLLGGNFVFKTPEIDSLLAYIEIRHLHDNRQLTERKAVTLLMRALDHPKLFIKNQDRERLVNRLSENDVKKWQAILEREATRQSWSVCAERLEHVSDAFSMLFSGPDAAQQLIMELVEILQWVKNLSNHAVSADSYRSAAEIIRSVMELVSTKPLRVYDFLKQVYRHTEQYHRVEQDQSQDALLITSIHRAKGQEYPLVLLPALREGVLPCYIDDEELSEALISDERRLFFVGMTRAIERLVLFVPQDTTSTPGDMKQYLKTSRFVDEAAPNYRVRLSQIAS